MQYAEISPIRCVVWLSHISRDSKPWFSGLNIGYPTLIPVVTVTPADIYDATKRAEELGVMNILAKPREPHALDMMLGQALMPIRARDYINGEI